MVRFRVLQHPFMFAQNSQRGYCRRYANLANLA